MSEIILLFYALLGVMTANAAIKASKRTDVHPVVLVFAWCAFVAVWPLAWSIVIHRILRKRRTR